MTNSADVWGTIVTPVGMAETSTQAMMASNRRDVATDRGLISYAAMLVITGQADGPVDEASAAYLRIADGAIAAYASLGSVSRVNHLRGTNY